MNNNKGITLITLVVTIIVMLILTAAATFTGVEVYKNIQVSNFISEMKLIQEKVNIINEKFKLSEYTTINDYLAAQQLDTSIHVNNTMNENSSMVLMDNDLVNAFKKSEFKSLLRDGEEYYLYKEDDVINKLGIKNLKDQKVLICFNTREVISVYGVKLKQDDSEVTFYTQYDLKNGEKLIEYTEPEKTPTPEESAKRTLTNVSNIGTLGTEIKTLIEREYCWIPRFAYKVTGYTDDNKISAVEVKFLKDSSYVDINGESINWDEWKILSFFEKGVGVKGLWFSKEPKETLLDLDLGQDYTIRWMTSEEREVIEIYAAYSDKVKNYTLEDFENRVIIIEK